MYNIHPSIPLHTFRIHGTGALMVRFWGWAIKRCQILVTFTWFVCSVKKNARHERIRFLIRTVMKRNSGPKEDWRREKTDVVVTLWPASPSMLGDKAQSARLP